MGEEEGGGIVPNHASMKSPPPNTRFFYFCLSCLWPIERSICYGLPKGGDPLTAPAHHTPDFFIDEGGFTLGVKALCNLALDYIAMSTKK